MSKPQATIVTNPVDWDTYLAEQQSHLLQRWAWGELKAQFDWSTIRLRAGTAAAQVLFRRLPFGYSIAYIPRGPAAGSETEWDELFTAIHTEAKKRRAIFLKVEPNGSAECDSANLLPYLQEAKFTAAETIQPRTTIVIDINSSEDDILGAMKQKTRYNIRLAGRKGVTVRRGSQADVAAFHTLAQETALRDEFTIHQLAYYQLAFNLFAPDQCAMLLAEYDDQPLAGLMAFHDGHTAYYFYGASSNEHRNLMAPYLLQWEAIRWAKEKGCRYYDLWGIPDADPATLEAEFTDRSDGLWGVYRFKRGFGGEVVRTAPAYDYVYNPMLYQFYKLRRNLVGG